jgi:hypothetical protein
VGDKAMASITSEVKNEVFKDQVSKLKAAIQTDESKVMLELLQLIDLKLIETPEDFLFTAINSRISAQSLSILVEAFNRQGVSVDSERPTSQRTAFDDACLDGYKEGVEALIKGGANYQRKMPNSMNSYLDFYKRYYPSQAAQINLVLNQPKAGESAVSNEPTVLSWLTSCLPMRSSTEAIYQPLTEPSNKAPKKKNH